MGTFQRYVHELFGGTVFIHYINQLIIKYLLNSQIKDNAVFDFNSYLANVWENKMMTIFKFKIIYYFVEKIPSTFVLKLESLLGTCIFISLSGSFIMYMQSHGSQLQELKNLSFYTEAVRV